MYTNEYCSIQITGLLTKYHVTQYMIIEIIDGDPDDVTEGQLFKASVKTVDNRTTVTLVSQEE